VDFSLADFASFKAVSTSFVVFSRSSTAAAPQAAQTSPPSTVPLGIRRAYRTIGMLPNRRLLPVFSLLRCARCVVLAAAHNCLLMPAQRRHVSVERQSREVPVDLTCE